MIEKIHGCLINCETSNLGKIIFQFGQLERNDKVIYKLYEMLYFNIYKYPILHSNYDSIVSEIDKAVYAIYQDQGINRIVFDLLECKYKLIAHGENFWSGQRLAPSPQGLETLRKELICDEMKYNEISVIDLFHGLVCFSNNDFLVARQKFNSAQKIADDTEIPLRFYNKGHRTYLPHTVNFISTRPVDSSTVKSSIKEKGDFRLIFCSDEKYFWAFFPILLEIASNMSNNVIFHFHIVNPSDELLIHISKKQKELNNINYSYENTPVNDKSYYTVVRLLRGGYFFDIYKGNITFLDIDSQLKPDISKFIGIVKDVDIGMLFSRGWATMIPWLRYTAALIYYGESPKAKEIINFISMQANEHYFNGIGPNDKWWIDQNILSFAMTNLRYCVENPVIMDLRPINIAEHNISYKNKQLNNLNGITE